MSLPDGRSLPILSGMRGQKRHALKPNEIAARIDAPRDDGVANRDRYLACLKDAAASLAHAPTPPKRT